MEAMDTQGHERDLLKVLWEITVELNYISWLLKSLSQENIREM